MRHFCQKFDSFVQTDKELTMSHHSFPLSVHFWERGAQPRSTAVEFAPGNLHQCCAFHLPPPGLARPLHPWGLGPSRQTSLYGTMPNGLPCPLASGWVRPTRDTRDRRMGQAFWARSPPLSPCQARVGSGCILSEAHSVGARSPLACADLLSLPAPSGGKRLPL